MTTFPKSKIALLSLCLSLIVLILGSCQKRRISYVEMINRENGEITDFFNKQGFSQADEFPSGLVTPEKTFVKVTDGLFVRVVKAGTKAPENGKTIVATRFNFESISPRATFSHILYGAQSGGTDPLPFVYYDTPERLELSPKASPGEVINKPLLCQALLRAVKVAGGDGAIVQIISSFRYNPSLTAQEGIPVYFSIVEFKFVK